MTEVDGRSDTNYADFEIGLHRRGEGGYSVELRLSFPNDDADIRLLNEPATPVGFDFERLLALASNDAEYGRHLSRMFFADRRVWEAFTRARDAAQHGEMGLRVRLYIGSGAHRLHGLRWEALRDLEFDAPLFAGEQVPFSRYLCSLDWRPVRARPQRWIRALVAVANPSNLGEYRLAPLDATAEAVRKGLSGADVSFINSAEGKERVTLVNILARLREGYDVLYLVAHGTQKDGESFIWLEDDEGKVSRAEGRDLVNRLRELGHQRPMLVVLASCQSAGSGQEDAPAGLGRQLTEVCVPAVLAMHSNISTKTLEDFIPAFFKELRRQGQIDRAMAVARSEIRDRADWWMPVLYMRLKSGRLWDDGVGVRPLTREEIATGLARLTQYARLCAPEATGLHERLNRQTNALLPALQNHGLTIGPESLEEVARISEEVLELDFVELARGRSPVPFPAESPFRGLYPFKAEQRRYFFGRDALVQRLRSRLEEHPFLALLGPSGSGKSSLALAGLVPVLQDAEPALRYVYMKPGAEPLARLEATLAATPERPLVLIVDQFEEVFTLCDSDEQRRAFFTRLLAPTPGMRVVLTMRADFWGECAPFEELRAAMQARQELIAPLSADELGLVIEQQAGAARLRFETDLVNVIVEDVRGEPGAMPLLQHALQQLWRRRHGRWLRTGEYRAGGGVQRSIAYTADSFYGTLRPEEQARVREIFLRLARLDDDFAVGGERRDTRQRVRLDELSPSFTLSQATHALVSRLADERLVITSRNPATGSEEVEVVHEALIRHWPRLRDWLEEDRAMLRLLEAVRRTAQEWDIFGRDESYLTHRGRRLEEAASLFSHPRAALNERERSYLDACREYERRQGSLTISIEAAECSGGIAIHVYLPGGDGGFAPPPGSAHVKSVSEIDLPGLRAFEGDAFAYGRFLSEQLFADPVLRQLLIKTLANPNDGLILRWVIDAAIPVLHDIVWETLCDPSTYKPLTGGGKVHVVRLMESAAARLRARTELRALVVVGPHDKDPHDAAARAASRLGPIQADVAPPAEGSLSAIAASLNEGHDVLYLIAVAELLRGEPHLSLGDGSGGRTLVRWSELAEALGGTKMRIVVLESPSDGGEPTRRGDGALPSLGARLTEAGVLSTIVVPPSMDAASADEALGAYFCEIYKHGRSDRAMAAARSAADAGRWPLTLYRCSEQDAIWYVPGFVSEQDNSRIWDALARNVQAGRLTPILGPNLSRRYLGTQRDWVRNINERLGQVSEGREAALTDVFQRLAVYQDRYFAQNAFIEDLRKELKLRHGSPTPAEDDATLAYLLAAAYRAECERDPLEPHRLLASLPLPLYITVNPFDLIGTALREVGKEPVIEVCRWNESITESPSVFKTDPDYRPSVERPLVYYLSGQMDEMPSLVLTEEDFFDHLTTTAEGRVIPTPIRAALANSPLFFIGHDEDERAFQFLLRSILVQQSLRRKGYHHFIQLEPKLRREAHHRYSQQVFAGLGMTVFAGNPEELLGELQERVSKFAHHEKLARPAEPEAATEPTPATESPIDSAHGQNTLVGPRPFVEGEHLYGRKREIADLVDLLIASRIVVLYGPSGAGKTSLIHAGLIERLAEMDYRVLPAIRVGIEPPADAPAANRYVWSALLSLSRERAGEGGLTAEDTARMTLQEGVDRLVADGEVFVLIFDQLEDLVTLSDNDLAEKREFFAQLDAVLRNPRAHALLSLREDSLGAVKDLGRELPTGLNTEFRLILLGADGAVEAMRELARKAGAEFAPGVAEKLVDELRSGRREEPDGTTRAVMGHYVDPVHLQLILRSLLVKLPSHVNLIDDAVVASSVDIKITLASYYRERVEVATAQAGVPERDIREWFERHLITGQGIRGQVFRGARESAGLDNRAIELLANAYLVRATLRHGAIWYELAHDALIEPVLMDNAVWFAANTGPVERPANLWHKLRGKR